MGQILLFVVCNAKTVLHYLENDAKVEIEPNLASFDTRTQCSVAQALFPYCKQGLTPININAHSHSSDTNLSVTTNSISAVALNDPDNG